MPDGLGAYSLLIRHAPARRRAPGHTVHRVRRGHPLAADLRVCLVFGGAYGIGVDLVTGSPLVAVGSPTMGASDDGPVLDCPATGYGQLPHDASYDVTGPVSIAVRSLMRAYNGAFLNKIPAGGSGGTNSTWQFGTTPWGTIDTIRSNSAYVLWQSNSAGVDVARMRSYGVSSPDVGTAPTFYFDGVADGANALYSNGGSGAAGTHTGPVSVGITPNGDNQLDGTLAIALVAAQIWSGHAHARFEDDAHGILEEAPLYHFMGRLGGVARWPFIFRH